MKEPARTLAEAVLLGAATLGAGLVVNALHPDGLSLTRDHFRTATDAPPAAAPPDAPPAPPGPSEAAGVAPVAAATGAVASEVADRLRARGLQVVSLAEARAIFEDPACAAGAYLFIDARGDAEYRAGHVPGAYQFDRYHPERHIEALLPACHAALKLVVYCLGGECEDSELATLDLQGMGVDPQRLQVYVGGLAEWTAAGLPVETGARGGGDD